MSPPTNERNGAPEGLLFITGTSLEDFKSRKNMTNVRKKAMGSYLKEKKPRASQKEKQQRKPREDSAVSRTSIGSDQQDVIPNSEAIRLMKGENRRKSSESMTMLGCSEMHRRKALESQVSQLPKISMNFVLPSAPMVTPSRTGVVLPYNETSPKPFQSIGKPLDPFRTLFQASHPQVSVEELKFHCSRSFGTKAMGIHWIPTLVKSPHAFLSTLCIASAHYDAVYELPEESVQTTALRQEVIHLISQNLLNAQTRGDDYNIIALMQLIASEIITGEDMMLNYHENGIEAIIGQRGGLEQLGVKGRLAIALAWVSLESAILREAKPRPQYTDYAATTASTRSYPITATIPESPLYCPRNEFETIKRSSSCTSRTIDLLKDIRMMMDLFLHETKQSRHNSLSLKNIHKKITTYYPPLTEIQDAIPPTPNDWRYEAIRITAILTATSIIHRIPLSEAVTYIPSSVQIHPLDSLQTDLTTTPSPRQDSPLSAPPNPFTFTPTTSLLRTSTSPVPSPPHPLTPLKIALSNSNLSDCWDDTAGVLLWIALTAGAASRGDSRTDSGTKVLRRWFKALAMRVSIVLSFEHPQALLASLLRMGDLVGGVGEEGGEKGMVAKGDGNERREKRRKS